MGRERVVLTISRRAHASLRVAGAGSGSRRVRGGREEEGEFYFLPHFTWYLYDLPLFTLTSPFCPNLLCKFIICPLTDRAHTHLPKYPSFTFPGWIDWSSSIRLGSGIARTRQKLPAAPVCPKQRNQAAATATPTAAGARDGGWRRYSSTAASPRAHGRGHSGSSSERTSRRGGERDGGGRRARRRGADGRTGAAIPTPPARGRADGRGAAAPPVRLGGGRRARRRDADERTGAATPAPPARERAGAGATMTGAAGEHARLGPSSAAAAGELRVRARCRVHASCAYVPPACESCAS